MNDMTAKLKKLYSEDYFDAYVNDPKREASYRIERDRIVDLKPDGGRVLDVGCGLGLFLAQFDSAKWEKYGVDVSEFAAEQARTRGITVKNYEQAYDYANEFFDVIVFRGTIQHLDTPFAVIKKCVELLKRGGLMVFLATPNSNSICFKLFGTLPFLNPRLNFLIPSDTMIADSLANFGLEDIVVRYPYLETPYARPLRDHLFFILRCFGAKVNFPFWGNIIEVYARKPK